MMEKNIWQHEKLVAIYYLVKKKSPESMYSMIFLIKTHVYICIYLCVYVLPCTEKMLDVYSPKY